MSGSSPKTLRSLREVRYAREVGPLLHFGVDSRSAELYQPQGVGAEHQMGRRVRGADHRKYRGRSLFRIPELVAVGGTAVCAHRIHQLVVVRDGAFGADHGSPCPVGAERAGRDGRDMDAEPCYLLAERLEDSLQGVLAAVVVRQTRHGHEPAHGGDGQNVARSPGPQVWQHRLDGGHRAENVDRELVS